MKLVRLTVNRLSLGVVGTEVGFSMVRKSPFASLTLGRLDHPPLRYGVATLPELDS
jgi:hypothetical protein